MRVLHTSDWHLGKTLRGRSRTDEFEKVLLEILDIAIRERADVVLVTGDIFDSVAPSAEAERLFYQGFLAPLHGYGIRAVLLGGNHDHPLRLAAVDKLLAVLGVNVVPAPKHPDRGGVVWVPSRDGTETAVVACLPWVPQRQVVQIEDLWGEPDAPFRAYSERVGQMLQSLVQAFRADTVNILAAHLMIDGAVVGPGGGERPLHLGETYAVPSQLLPEAAQYVALGHIHRPQEIAAAAPTRYAGSALQLDFGEVAQEKSVVLVDAHPGQRIRADLVPLKSGRSLRDLAVSLGDLPALARYADEHAFFRVTVFTDGPVPSLAERVREVLPSALQVIAQHPRSRATAAIDGDLGPEALLAEYHRQAHRGADPAPELMALFRKLYEEVSSGEAP